MDVLKSARRVMRSPSVSKQPQDKHKKLPENWTDTRETLVDGMTFNLRHMGMTLVDQPKGEDVSAAAIKRIIATAKARGKKLLKVALTVSPQEMLIYDRVSNQLIERTSIYRISYCTADKMHDKVFAYIVQNQRNKMLECHAFLCAKKKVAQAVTLTVAQAFNMAFESWQLDREESVKENLLDFEDCPKLHIENTENLEHHLEKHKENENSIIWEVNDGLDEAFSRCSLDSFEYSADLPSPVLSPRSWTLG
ncbi:low density lipoprotein receptor adapter protein 1a isoform X2 [Tachysurus fulvidraco]|uniref:low density lipoprotein receptor adapter protein 1a isoform X2 n=1 Tax=Tachysurus fulvidraco TaxID=1234273 RepID=UPI001FEE2E1E|nr:low density lipoprotein receptor adapter protein 1a isoform X2 [Tachysurus fulvidraco]